MEIEFNDTARLHPIGFKKLPLKHNHQWLTQTSLYCLHANFTFYISLWDWTEKMTFQRCPKVTNYVVGYSSKENKLLSIEKKMVGDLQYPYQLTMTCYKHMKKPTRTVTITENIILTHKTYSRTLQHRIPWTNFKTFRRFITLQ